jgi:hypothetical protein
LSIINYVVPPLFDEEKLTTLPLQFVILLADLPSVGLTVIINVFDTPL